MFHEILNQNILNKLFPAQALVRLTLISVVKNICIANYFSIRLDDETQLSHTMNKHIDLICRCISCAYKD